MSPASSRWRGPLGKAGSSSLEFALVAGPFLLLLIAGMDLGRYFITLHSLRTLTSEAARSTLVSCYGKGACTLQNPQTAEATAPFLVPSQIVLTASQPAPDPTTGVTTISVTAQYPFTFILLNWIGLTGPITATTSLSY